MDTKLFPGCENKMNAETIGVRDPLIGIGVMIIVLVSAVVCFYPRDPRDPDDKI